MGKKSLSGSDGVVPQRGPGLCTSPRASGAREVGWGQGDVSPGGTKLCLGSRRLARWRLTAPTLIKGLESHRSPCGAGRRPPFPGTCQGASGHFPPPGRVGPGCGDAAGTALSPGCPRFPSEDSRRPSFLLSQRSHKAGNPHGFMGPQSGAGKAPAPLPVWSPGLRAATVLTPGF